MNHLKDYLRKNIVPILKSRGIYGYMFLVSIDPVRNTILAGHQGGLDSSDHYDSNIPDITTKNDKIFIGQKLLMIHVLHKHIYSLSGIKEATICVYANGDIDIDLDVVDDIQSNDSKSSKNSIIKPTTKITPYNLSPKGLKEIVPQSGFNDGCGYDIKDDIMKKLENLYGKPLPTLFKNMIRILNGYSLNICLDVTKDGRMHLAPLNTYLSSYSFAGLLSFASDGELNNINKLLAPWKFSKNDCDHFLSIGKIVETGKYSIVFGVAYDGSFYSLYNDCVFYNPVNDPDENVSRPIAPSFDVFINSLYHNRNKWGKYSTPFYTK